MTKMIRTAVTATSLRIETLFLHMLRLGALSGVFITAIWMIQAGATGILHLNGCGSLTRDPLIPVACKMAPAFDLKAMADRSAVLMDGVQLNLH